MKYNMDEAAGIMKGEGKYEEDKDLFDDMENGVQRVKLVWSNLRELAEGKELPLNPYDVSTTEGMSWFFDFCKDKGENGK